MRLFVLCCVLFLAACQAEKKNETSDLGATGIPIIDSLTALITQYPNNAQLVAARATAFNKRRNCEMAIKDMARALNLDSTNLQYHHQLADIYLDCELSMMGLRTMERAVKLYPDSIGTLLKMAEFQYLLEQYQGSLASIDQVFKNEPNNVEAYFMLGQNFRALGDTVRALKSYQKAVAFDAEHADAHLSIALMYDHQNNPIALRYFDNALRIDSLNVNAHYAKGLFYLHRFQDEEALAIFRKVVGIDSRFEKAYLSSGIIYLDRGELAKALDQFSICTKQKALIPTAYYYMGLTLERMGKDSIQAAIANYKIALGQSPSYKEASDAINRLSGK